MSSLKQFQRDFFQLAYGTQAEQANVLDQNHYFSALPMHQVQQYQWMVYANHAETLETIFPYCYQLLQSVWETLVKDYLRLYPPSDYQLYGAALRFPEFLGEQAKWMENIPFLVDLARYELLEATILRWPDGPVSPAKLNDFEPLDQKAPILNPAGQAYTSDYPIHTLVEQIKAETLDANELRNTAPSPLCLWVYRDEQFDCRFFQVSPFLQHFLADALHNDAGKSYDTLLRSTCQALNITMTPDITMKFPLLLQNLESKSILLGSRSWQ